LRSPLPPPAPRLRSCTREATPTPRRKYLPVLQPRPLTNIWHRYTKYTTVVEKVPTTIYQTVKKPDQTVYDKAYETKTITKEHPVTETKYVDGETVVVVHTETEYIKTWVPVTHYATVEAPDVTHTSKEVAYQTITKEHPVTQTKVCCFCQHQLHVALPLRTVTDPFS
jgi:hypothetical protein